MRRESDQVMALVVSPEERATIDALCAVGAYTSASNAIRSALWSLADHYGMEMGPGVFDQRSNRGLEWDAVEKVVKPKETRVPKHVKQNDGTRAARPKPKKTHPWRRYGEGAKS